MAYAIATAVLVAVGGGLTFAGVRWARRSQVEPTADLHRAGQSDENDPSTAARRAIGKSSWTLIGGGGV